MSKYLAESEISHAVEQLGRSSAKGRMCEFLIGLRTLRLAGTESVAIAESVPQFIQALEEFSLWPAVISDDIASPYFNPFGSQADFKSPKFRSNGPSNTMHGWATQADSPFDILNTTRPKSIRRRSLPGTQLRTFLIQSHKEADRPRLIDAAVWFYRRVDLEREDGTVPSRTELEAKFINDLGLTEEDVAYLFRLENEDSEADAQIPEEAGVPLVDSDEAEGLDSA